MRCGKGLRLSTATACAALLSATVSTSTAAASPAPQNDPTSGQERMASFARRQQMERTSIFQNLEFRNIGPTENFSVLFRTFP